ncbi:hypothetical protein SKAU_G00039360 [Synaphobranchus kaupii]|uniref:Uncharacterized protein n=1 Tax=Synaphobranchus kaupii TaxID=118154 RepID=A0A9Q1JF57_SYNKA|nr:hypothetical protein SKAU_G00039360 [Synaphobranchus kaupii]
MPVQVTTELVKDHTIIPQPGFHTQLVWRKVGKGGNRGAPENERNRERNRSGGTAGRLFRRFPALRAGERRDRSFRFAVCRGLLTLSGVMIKVCSMYGSVAPQRGSWRLPPASLPAVPNTPTKKERAEPLRQSCSDRPACQGKGRFSGSGGKSMCLAHSTSSHDADAAVRVGLPLCGVSRRR